MNSLLALWTVEFCVNGILTLPTICNELLDNMGHYFDLDYLIVVRIVWNK